MKYLVISDIHGSHNAALSAIEAFKHHNCDQIICLGDILYHGPRNDLPVSYNPKEVIKLFNQYKDKFISVCGNCDAYVDQMILEFPITSDYNIIYHQNHKFFLSHGHLYSPTNKPTLTSDDYLLTGHTHIPTVDNHMLNPGSIALPKENHPQTYAILDDNFTIYTLDHKVYMQTSL